MVNRQSAGDLGGSEDTLYDTIWWIHGMVRWSKPTEYPTPRMNPDVHHGLYLTVTCHNWLINGKQRPTLMQDVT